MIFYFYCLNIFQQLIVEIVLEIKQSIPIFKIYFFCFSIEKNYKCNIVIFSPLLFIVNQIIQFIYVNKYWKIT